MTTPRRDHLLLASWRPLGVLLVVAMLVTGGCAGGPPDDARKLVKASAGADDRAALSGAGSTFAATMVEEWVRLYRDRAPGVDIRYDAIGSGAGIGRLLSRSSDFAVSEVTLDKNEQRAAGTPGTVQVPLVGGAVAVIYNLPGVDGLRLSEGTLARIFTGEVRRWDHPAVRADNAGRQLPSTAVTAVHRSDGSGTTLAFTRYLGTAGRDVWAPGEGPSVDWPAGTGAAGSAAVLTAVSATAGAVGYVAAGPARNAPVQAALVRNSAGAFLAPTPAAVDSALIGAFGVDDNLTLSVPAEQDSPTAYPIVVISHLVFPAGLPPEKDVALRHFAAWLLSEGQQSVPRVGFTPLPLPLLVRSLEGLLFGGLQPRR